MDSTMIHICLETAEAPDPTVEVEEGTRWVCKCGDNFVYRGGFNRGGGYGLEWFPAPPVAPVIVPKQRQSLGSRLFSQRKG
jgi:hypothetical protein